MFGTIQSASAAISSAISRSPDATLTPWPPAVRNLPEKLPSPSPTTESDPCLPSSMEALTALKGAVTPENVDLPIVRLTYGTRPYADTRSPFGDFHVTAPSRLQTRSVCGFSDHVPSGATRTPLLSPKSVKIARWYSTTTVRPAGPVPL